MGQVQIWWVKKLACVTKHWWQWFFFGLFGAYPLLMLQWANTYWKAEWRVLKSGYIIITVCLCRSEHSCDKAHTTQLSISKHCQWFCNIEKYKRVFFSIFGSFGPNCTDWTTRLSSSRVLTCFFQSIRSWSLKRKGHRNIKICSCHFWYVLHLVISVMTEWLQKSGFFVFVVLSV